jgi:hypothetical protein
VVKKMNRLGNIGADPCEFLGENWPVAVTLREMISSGQRETGFWEFAPKSMEHVARRTIEDALTMLQQRGLATQIDDLKRDVEALREVAFNGGVIVPLGSLAPAPIYVIKPFYVHIRIEDDCYLASFVDANINASGESEFDAIEMLKDAIVSTFQLFIDNEPSLGRGPTRQLAVLREYMRRA